MRPNWDPKDEPGKRVELGKVSVWSVVLCLVPSAAFAGSAVPEDQFLVVSAVMTGALALAIAAGLWAIAEQNTAAKLRRMLRNYGARTRSIIGERDALLSAGSEALIVWGRDLAQPVSYGAAERLLDLCLSGPDALTVSKALDELSAKGLGFGISAHDGSGRTFVLRGRAVGGMAAVWLAETKTAAASGFSFGDILDALPVPVWLRDRSLALVWGNRSFLSATGSASLDAARANQVSLDRNERDLAATAKNQAAVHEARRFAIAGGQRRALLFNETPVDGLGIVGSAFDVTDLSVAESKLQQHIDAHADTLDKLATAVAIFSRDQKLTFFNRAFVTMWSLPETWLDSHPSDADILDRLRENRRLPEQRDYQSWKRRRLALYDNPREGAFEDLWHVPGGKTLRVVAQPHPFGGLTFLYEDVTERIALESSYNTLTKVQSATLNSLQEGVAVFGPDGKLKLYNSAFLRIWELGTKDLAGEPHLRSIAVAATETFGDETLWERLIQSIVSGSTGMHDFGTVERNDHSVLAISLSQLPDGATAVTFTDVTDRSRIESALRERGEALEAADHLKSEFIKHVSYELRTPLNTIMGFAELLASGLPGQLNSAQSGYLQDIISGSNTLKDLINNILDLSLIESGALRLELGRIDLHALLTGVAATARDWAAAAKLELVLDCPQDVGAFRGDERRIQQVVFNLLSNAFKYTPPGGTITLSGRIETEDVQISVADTGPGIAPEVQANVFDRFAAKSRSGQRAGAGLGLALVNRFVELHDGWVEIESGNGTLVRCHFPKRLFDEGPAARQSG